ncbi:MAG: hypothetical protein HY263_08410 [Chloroflexi bacterium]|nr:hypothetical protein [Chloroflexota bacterium]
MALIGAGLLTLSVAGIALASTNLLAGQVGITLGSKDKTGTEDCAGIEVPDGQVFLHFVLTQTTDSDGSIDATFSNPAGTFHQDHKTKAAGGTLQWDGYVTGDADTVLESAVTSADGDNLVLSHACFGAPAESQPAESQPAESESAPPSFTSTEEPATDVPSEPNTATVPTSGTSGPSDSSWLLVAALGVILASVVVMTPARAKNRR